MRVIVLCLISLLTVVGGCRKKSSSPTPGGNPPGNPPDTNPPVQTGAFVYGGSANEMLTCITPTADGHFILAGSSESKDGDVTSNKGAEDVWIVKMKRDGSIAWQRSYGGSMFETANCIAPTPDGGYVLVGNAQSSDGDIGEGNGKIDLMVMKIDKDGNRLWTRTYGGTETDYGNNVIVSTDGSLLVLGSTASTNGTVTNKLGGAGNYDIWLLKLSSTGNVLWQKTLGGTNDDMGNQLLRVNSGGYMIAGVTSSHGLQVTGNHGKQDAWVVKINDSGDIQWSRCFGGTDDDEATRIVAIDGGYMVAGHARSKNGNLAANKGMTDLWLMKLDAAGNVIWSKNYGGASYDHAQAIVPVPAGGYLVCGYSASDNGDITVNRGGMDAWVLWVNGSGAILWQKTYGGPFTDQAFAGSADNDGYFYLVGQTNSISGDIPANKGMADAWVMKFKE